MKYLIAFSLVLVACGKAPQAVTPDTPVDPLRANLAWQSTEPWIATDFPVQTTGTGKINWTLAYDEQCQSDVVYNNGTATLSNSTEISSTQGSDEPCSAFDGTWTYAVSSSALTLCPSSGPCIVLN